MLYLIRFRSIVTGFLLTLFLSSMSSSVLAKRPVKDSTSNGNTSTSSCLSGKEYNQLAKSYLSELVLIDSSVTLTDVKTEMKSAGDCATVAELDYVIEQYSIRLANTAPVISGSPALSIAEGGFYIFTPVASDENADELTFSVINLPSWAYFDAETGTILGIPMANHIGLHQDIVISVSDGIASSSLAAINIEVTAVDSSTQSPLLGEITSYSVYMGVASNDLSSQIDLTIGQQAVVPVGNPLPVTDTYYLYVIARDRDGNSMVLPATEIGGYRIYIGTSSDDLNPIYNFADGTDKIYWVNSLQSGTYFVSIATYDIHGNETQLSDIAQFDLI